MRHPPGNRATRRDPDSSPSGPNRQPWAHPQATALNADPHLTRKHEPEHPLSPTRANVHPSIATNGKVHPGGDAGREQLVARASDLAGLFTPSDAIAPASLRVALGDAAASGVPYVRAVQSLDEAVKADGTAWLAAIVTGLRSASADLAPGLGLFASLSTAAG